MIADTPVNLAVWQRQREVQQRKQQADLLELGFSTFFLNRTNRSGIPYKEAAPLYPHAALDAASPENEGDSVSSTE